MRPALRGSVAAFALWACGGQTAAVGRDAGGDSTGSSGSSSGGSGSSSGASSSGSGGSSSSSGGGSSSGSSSGVPPVNHRPNDTQCLGPAPSGTCHPGLGGTYLCSTDSQCADGGVNGRCMQNIGGPAPAVACRCTSDTCADDGACPTGRTCACHGSPYDDFAGNECVPGNCRVDADCGPGGWCSPTVSLSSCLRIAGYYCHTPKDQCVNDGDCTDGGAAPLACDYDTTAGYWSCVPNPGCS